MSSTQYTGNTVSFVKAIHPQSFMDFLNLDLDILEDIKYQTRDDSRRVFQEECVLFELIIKIGSLDFAKYSAQFLVDAYGTEFTAPLYNSLLHRDESFIKEVLAHLAKDYTDDMLCQVDEKRYTTFLPEFFVQDTKADKLNIFDNYDCSFLETKTPREILEQVDMINQYAREDKTVFPLYHLVQAYVANIDDEALRAEFSEKTIEFLLEKDYRLEPAVTAPIFCALSRANIESMDKLWDKLATSYETEPFSNLFESDLVENMFDYLVSVFSAHQKTKGIDKLLGSLRPSSDFLFNQEFAQLLINKKVFKEDIGSLESLVYAHYDYIASGAKQFNSELLKNVTFSEGVLQYIEHADLTLKLALFKGLSAHPQLHEKLNEYVYENIFKKSFFDEEYLGKLKNSSDKERVIKKVKEHQDNYVDFLNQFVQYPNFFKQYVERHIDTNTLSVENQQFYFNVFIKDNNVKVAKLKI